ncbi:MAG: hypothetical protein C0605_15670 [Hyphomicrobiales bacterium]|nr:MAG: hypothetical protein C0605_15670 [Hyphomicrobiales bacterium]
MLILSLVYCVSALSLDADFNPVNEKFYPFVLSVLMILLSVGLMIWPSAQATTWPNWKNFQRIAITFIAILLYSLVLQKVGFIISAGLLMAICMWVFEADLKWIAPTSLIIVVSFYVVFDRMLGLNLPAGILGFL